MTPENVSRKHIPKTCPKNVSHKIKQCHNRWFECVHIPRNEQKNPKKTLKNTHQSGNRENEEENSTDQPHLKPQKGNTYTKTHHNIKHKI